MVISKKCDCGELDRVECQCAFFEEFIERDAWQGIPMFDDMDYGPEEEAIEYEDNDHEWGELESTMESVSPQ